MISFLIRIAVNALALLAIGALSGGTIVFTGFGQAVLAAIALGIANAVVKPVLQTIAEGMTCVLSCLTLGLSSLIISWLVNGFLFYAAGAYLGLFEIQGFWPTMLGALALSIVNAFVGAFTSQEKRS